MLDTLPPIVMEVKNGCVSNRIVTFQFPLNHELWEKEQPIKKLMITLHFSVGIFHKLLPKKLLLKFPIYISNIIYRLLEWNFWTLKNPGIPSG